MFLAYLVFERARVCLYVIGLFENLTDFWRHCAIISQKFALKIWNWYLPVFMLTRLGERTDFDLSIAYDYFLFRIIFFSNFDFEFNEFGVKMLALNPAAMSLHYVHYYRFDFGWEIVCRLFSWCVYVCVHSGGGHPG